MLTLKTKANQIAKEKTVGEKPPFAGTAAMISWWYVWG
jgi:hypothetical protein